MLFLQNDSLPSLFFMQLDITVSCNNSVDCTPSHLICELVLREDSSKNTRDIYEDRTKCAKKEFEPIFPVNDHGFGEENVSDEIRSIAAFAVQHVENNGDAKRSVVDIMSVKRQVIKYIIFRRIFIKMMLKYYSCMFSVLDVKHASGPVMAHGPEVAKMLLIK